MTILRKPAPGATCKETCCGCNRPVGPYGYCEECPAGVGIRYEWSAYVEVNLTGSESLYEQRKFERELDA